MSRDFEKLRRLVNEELSKLDEYRPNTFMLSRMEEKEKADQDGDGDEDFDDVRVARYTKGGMSREKALAKVKRKPMGDGGKKHESMSLSESIRKMTRAERSALHEAVKRRILKEAVNGAESLNSASDGSTVIIKGTDRVAYVKRGSVWFVGIKLDISQLLSFAKEDRREQIKRQIDKVAMQGEFTIRTADIIESKREEINDAPVGFRFKKTPNGYEDPVPLTGEALFEIIKDFKGLELKSAKGVEKAAEIGGLQSRALGTQGSVEVVRLSSIPGSVFVRIKYDPDFSGFYEIFKEKPVRKAFKDDISKSIKKITFGSKGANGNNLVKPEFLDTFEKINPSNGSLSFELGLQVQGSDAEISDFNEQNKNFYVCQILNGNGLLNSLFGVRDSAAGGTPATTPAAPAATPAASAPQ